MRQSFFIISLSFKFPDLTVTHIRTINSKPDQGPDLMPALFAVCAGVHVKTIVLRIKHDFQDM